MANFTADNDITMGQGADFTGKLYYIVKLSATAGLVSLSSAATDKHIGVLSQLNKAASTATGATVNVHSLNSAGTFKVIAGGTISIGDYITADANGKAVATTTGSDNAIGIAKEAAVTGQIFEYLCVARKI